MPNINLSILNQRQTPAFFADTLANRPAAGFLGRIFVSTDTFAFYRDNGTGWDLIGGPGTGTITGTGASGQIALWNGASTITGDTGLTYDGTANSLTADKFIVSGGTSSQFLKGDGSLDSSTYLTTNIYNGNGTLSGERTISLNGNNLIFDGGSSIARVRMDADTDIARIFSFATNNLPRWAFRVDGTEIGSNAGSDFAIRRYNDAGTFVDAPFSINRATGQSTFAKKVVIENNTGDQQLQIVSSTAPSLRIDNLQTGATRRIGIGLATTTNNFIQGTTGGEMAIFNSSTTASPILFGVYDAGLSNTQEAARISAARNFIVGSSVDAGFKFDVNGAARVTGVIYADNSIRVANGIIGTNSNNLLLSSNTAAGEIIFYKNQLGTRIASFGSDNALEIGYVDALNSAMKLSWAGASTYGKIQTYSSSFLALNPEGNNVGINRTTAEFALDVTGDIAISRTSKFQFTGGTAGDRQRSYLTGNPNNDVFVYVPNGLNTTFTHSNNVLIGGSTDTGIKLQVTGDISATKNILIENATNGEIQNGINANSVNSQGSFRWRTYGRGYVKTGAGTKIIIPFFSQTNINLVTIARITVCSADFNSAFGGSTQITFSVGSLNALSNLVVLSSGGNYVSAAINGMNVEITTGAYDAIYMYLEYLTPYTEYSIALGNITLT